MVAVLADASLRAGRRPLALLPLKDPAGRRALSALARAELDHSRDDWARLVARHGLADLFDEGAPWQPHPSEPYRLAHEAWAATLLNIEGHLVGADLLVGRAIDVLRGQRLAARRSADWTERARVTEAELVATLLPRRRAVWRAFLTAARRYRSARATLHGLRWQHAA